MTSKIQYYKFLPVIISALTMILIGCILYSYYEYNLPGDLTGSKTMRSLKSEKFQHSVYYSMGLLTPLCIDQIFTLWTMWSPDILLHVEAYILPVLIVILQVFSFIFAFMEVNRAYLITHLFFVRYQACVMFNAAFVIQVSAVETNEKKESTNTSITTVNNRILPILIFTMSLFNLSIILSLLCAYYNREWLMILWEITIVSEGIGSCYILYYWWNKYQIATKTGLQNQSHFFSFLEMLLILVFLLVIEIYDLMTHNSIVLHSSEKRVSAYNLLIVFCVYGLSEIYAMKSKRQAQFSVEALETKRSFVRYVSHEIRTPLNAATLGLQLLDKELHKQIARTSSSQQTLPETVATVNRTVYKQLLELVADTNQACVIAVEILNDLLMYEKIDGGLLVLEAQEVNLWPFVEEVLKIFSVQAKALELNLVWRPLIDTRVFVIIDRYKMSQVIRNIISNALKFSQAGQTVEVYATIIEGRSYRQNTMYPIIPHFSKPKSVSSQESRIRPETADNEQSKLSDVESQQADISNKYTWEHFFHRNASIYHEQHRTKSPTNSVTINNVDVDYIRITVKDTGPGISQENQKRLFREVVQFDAAKLQQGKGSGIGLWISNKIMKLHGGKIGVESEGEGLGSEFYIDIPIRRTEMILPAARSTPTSHVLFRALLPTADLRTSSRSSSLGIRSLHSGSTPGSRNSNSKNIESSTSNNSRPSRQNSSSLLSRLGTSASNLLTNRSSVVTSDLAAPIPPSSSSPERNTHQESTAPNTDMMMLPPRFIPKLGSFKEIVQTSSQSDKVPQRPQQVIEGEQDDDSVPHLDPINTIHEDLVPSTMEEGGQLRQQTVTPSNRQRLRKNEIANSGKAKSPSHGGSSLPVVAAPSIIHPSNTPVTATTTNTATVTTVTASLPSSPLTSSSRKKALLVDDSPVNRKMLRKCCLSYFDICDEANNGKDAIVQVEKQIASYKQKCSTTNKAVSQPLPQEAFGYNLIITDYFMPGMNGVELIKQLRAMQYTGKIVGLTGNTEAEMKDAFLQAGANMVLIKPLSADDFHQVVQDLS